MLYDTDHSHDPQRRSWIERANDPDNDFPIQNLPLGVFCLEDEDDDDARVGVAIGDHILDLAACAEQGLLDDVEEQLDEEDDLEDTLNAPMLGLVILGGPNLWSAIRHRVGELLDEQNPIIRDKKKLRSTLLVPMEDARLLIPDEIGDYTDFYASIHHATNVGSMFRPDNPLLPNYSWLPVAYHGRASSIVASGADIRRPNGQILTDDQPPPVFAPSRMLDYELELGCLIGPGSERGERITIDRAEEEIFGVCLVNDWSARDIQKWEYQPLGPFLAKSFATTISPWIVTLEALAPFRCPAAERPADRPAPLPHLHCEDNAQRGGIDLNLEVYIRSKSMRDQGMPPHLVSATNFKHMHWTIAQMLAHHASNGCNMEPGDLIASGTVSGPAPDERGCLLERTWNGSAQDPRAGHDRTPIELPTAEQRVFLEDHDEVILRGYCHRQGFRRIGLGLCHGIVLPAYDA